MLKIESISETVFYQKLGFFVFAFVCIPFLLAATWKQDWSSVSLND